MGSYTKTKSWNLMYHLSALLWSHLQNMTLEPNVFSTKEHLKSGFGCFPIALVSLTISTIVSYRKHYSRMIILYQLVWLMIQIHLEFFSQSKSITKIQPCKSKHEGENALPFTRRSLYKVNETVIFPRIHYVKGKYFSLRRLTGNKFHRAIL